MQVEASWVLALMFELMPKSPHTSTFERTAEAIARHANASPLFDGENGPKKTAAVIASIAKYESGGQPDAEGDCPITKPDGTCASGKPTSFCLLQINQSNFKRLGVTREEIQSDVDVCVATGLRIMHASFSVCRARPLEERLAAYAGGGDGCSSKPDAIRKSAHRMRSAMFAFVRVLDRFSTPRWLDAFMQRSTDV